MSKLVLSVGISAAVPGLGNYSKGWYVELGGGWEWGTYYTRPSWSSGSITQLPVGKGVGASIGLSYAPGAISDLAGYSVGGSVATGIWGGGINFGAQTKPNYYESGKTDFNGAVGATLSAGHQLGAETGTYYTTMKKQGTLNTTQPAPYNTSGEIGIDASSIDNGGDLPPLSSSDAFRVISSDFRVAPNQAAGMTAVSLSGRASQAMFGSTSNLSSIIGSVIGSGSNGWNPAATGAISSFSGWGGASGGRSGTATTSACMPWDAAPNKDQQALRAQMLEADPSKGMLLGYNGPYPIYAWSAWQKGGYKTPTFFEKPDGSLWYEGPGLRQGKNPLGTGQVLSDGYNTYRASDMSFLGRGSVVNLSMPGGSSIVKIAEQATVASNDATPLLLGKVVAA